MDEGRGVFGFDHEPCARLFDDLHGLAVYAKNHWPATRHEFEHLGRDDGLEDVGLFQKHETGVGCQDEGWNLFARLLIDESDISQSSRLGGGFDAFFFGSLSYEKKNHIWILVLQFGGSIQQSVQSVGVTHRADVAGHKLPFKAKVLADVIGAMG